jgi:voltage-dependent potassium channel beta subunit
LNYRRIGNSGLKVSAVSLGAWTTYGHTVQDRQVVRDIVARAVEAGINFFDNADAYARGEAERVMARVYNDLDLPRHHLVLSTKVYWPMSDAVTDRGLSRKHVLESIDHSLERMETDYVDLYFAHRYDVETSLEEIVEGFSDVVRSGRALYWGTSEWPRHRIAEAVAFARANGLVAPIVEQPQYSMLYRQRVESEILPVTDEKGMGLVVFSPLAQGMLTGKYDGGVPEGSRFDNFKQTGDRLLTDENAAKVRALKDVADDLGVTRAQLALAWVLRQPGVASVITGATRVEQLEDNLQAAELTLSDADLARIDEALGD